MKKKMPIFVILLCLVVTGIASYFLINNKNQYEVGEITYKKAIEEYVKPQTKTAKSTKTNKGIAPDIDFKKLKSVNPNVVAWLKYDACGIDYPVCQGEDNSHYLYYTYEEKENVNGCLFLNTSNQSSFEDPHSLIFGHNMKSGAMFGSLKKLTDEKYAKKNNTFWLCTPEGSYQYEIFSVHETPNEGEAYTIFESNDGQFAKWVMSMQAESLFDFDTEITIDDTILTLSTCTTTEENRLVVHAKKLAQKF